MHKRKLRHYWHRLRALPALLFIALGIGLAVISVYALRSNNQRMLELRTAVFTADEQNGDVEGALRELRTYVYAHMNTDLAASDNAIRPPIQLKYTYERLVAAEKARVAVANEQMNTQAQAVCEQRIRAGESSRIRVSCIQDYLSANGTTERDIPEDLYKFDFASPSWSPDLAGWSMVGAGVCFFLAIFSFGAERLIRRNLQRHV